MAKLVNGRELRLDGEEGRLLKDMGYAYIGVDVVSHDIVITPARENNFIMVDDALAKKLVIDAPHVVVSVLCGYIIDVTGLGKYLPDMELKATENMVGMHNGVITPATITLSPIVDEPEKESIEENEFSNTIPDFNEDDYYKHNDKPESLAALKKELNIRALCDLKDMATALGLSVRKKDYTATLITKICNYWKRQGIK